MNHRLIETAANTSAWLCTGILIVLAPVAIGFSAGLVFGLMRSGWQASLAFFP